MAEWGVSSVSVHCIKKITSNTQKLFWCRRRSEALIISENLNLNVIQHVVNNFRHNSLASLNEARICNGTHPPS